MRPRHPLPRLWLFTDERMGEALLPAIGRLPKGRAGVIFRHYHTPEAVRRELLNAVSRVSRKRRLALLVAGPDHGLPSWRSEGFHGRTPHKERRKRLRSVPVHSIRELRQAERAGASLVFLSPVFATASHPGAGYLGRVRFGRLARSSRLPVMALGGIDHRNFRSLKPLGACGFGAIDAWIRS